MEGINTTKQVNSAESQKAIESPQSEAEKVLYEAYIKMMAEDRIEGLVVSKETVERSSERI